MNQAETLRWAETCSARIDSLKSVLDDSILELKKLKHASTNSAVVAIEDIERNVSQGYDQIVDAFKTLRLRLSILNLKAVDLAEEKEECIEKIEQCK